MQAYAERTLEIVDGKHGIPLSRPGAPPPSKTYGTKYWHHDPVYGWGNGLTHRRQQPRNVIDNPDTEDASAIGEANDIQLGDQAPQPNGLSETGAMWREEPGSASPPAAAVDAETEPSPERTEIANPPRRALETERPPAVSDLDDVGRAMIAERFFESAKGEGGILWQSINLPSGTFDPERLIPALERGVAANLDRGFMGELLSAARKGEAREHYAAFREHCVLFYASFLNDNILHKIEEMRSVGLVA